MLHQLYLVKREVSAIRMSSARRNISRAPTYHEKIQVVLNRHQSETSLMTPRLKAIQKIHWRVPNHYPQVVKIIHEGDPVAQLGNPKSDAA